MCMINIIIMLATVFNGGQGAFHATGVTNGNLIQLLMARELLPNTKNRYSNRMSYTMEFCTAITSDTCCKLFPDQ